MGHVGMHMLSNHRCSNGNTFGDKASCVEASILLCHPSKFA